MASASSSLSILSSFSPKLGERKERNEGVFEVRQWVHWSVQDALTKYTDQRWLQRSQLCIFHSYGGLESKIRALASFMSSMASILQLQMATFSLCPHLVFPLCVPVSFFFYHLSYLFIFIWLHRLFIRACSIFCFAMQILNCSMWTLVPWPGIEPGPPALEAQNPNHWITREVPCSWALSPLLIRTPVMLDWCLL